MACLAFVYRAYLKVEKRMVKTYQRYIFRLWFIPFLTIFVLVSLVFLLQRVVIWLPKLVEHDAPISLIASLFTSMMPTDWVMTIPIAFCFSFMRLILDLQTNSELDALYAGGLSLFNIFASVFWAGIVLTVLMLVLTLELVPLSKIKSYHMIAKLTHLKAAPSFEPKQFVRDVEGMVFYYEGKHDDGSYAQFMLADMRDASQTTLYIADSAVISPTDVGMAVHLYDGTQLSGEKDHISSVRFSDYEIVIPLENTKPYYARVNDNAPDYMGLKKLWRNLHRSDRHMANFQFRLVLALSVLLLFLYTIPLAIRPKRSRQGSVFLWAILVMWLINQSELVVFHKMEVSALPWWSLWLLFAIFAGMGIKMLYITHKHGYMQFKHLFKQ